MYGGRKRDRGVERVSLVRENTHMRKRERWVKNVRKSGCR